MAKQPASPSQPPPPLCFYYLGKTLHVLRHAGQWWLLARDVPPITGARLGRRVRQLIAADKAQVYLPSGNDHLNNNLVEYWRTTDLLRALRRSNKPLARQLRTWLDRQLIPALHQLPPAAPHWEQALALAAEAGMQVSHAVLQAVLQQEGGWKRSHWLLTLNYSPDHPQRHAHGRLLGLNSMATPLQALAQQIATPQGISADSGELLQLASACHQQLRSRLQRRACREQAAGASRH